MKYSVYDEDELRIKMDVVRQELGKKFNCVMIGWSDFCQGLDYGCKKVKMVLGQIVTRIKEVVSGMNLLRHG